MKYEIINGVIVKQHHSEKNHLDRALDEYTIQAERYFEARNKLERAPEDLREQRKKELKEIKKC
ncbi:hypothetical protein [Aliikangiella sp. IMCC44359]|uniref:hypothetical protein n=1 Tax=Aliikangiella sp. IMCC44359 TaxID=3459125 RepID=UPI00403AB0E3